jgi:palmitoyl-protein thioesterase
MKLSWNGIFALVLVGATACCSSKVDEAIRHYDNDNDVDGDVDVDDQDATNKKVCDTPELRDHHPVLCHMLDRLAEDAHGLAEEMTAWASQHNLLVGQDWDFDQHKDLLLLEDVVPQTTASSSSVASLPVVFAHGMGDSCYNSGMQHIASFTSDLLGKVYTTCIPTGKNRQDDTSSGYFLNMDASVDFFAAKIRQDPKLTDGFHAIGFSQGNNVIRGYIARYNDPPVHTFLSINGVNGGVGAVPYCIPKEQQQDSLQQSTTATTTTITTMGMCDLLMEQASKRAYTEFAQEHSFQANYWRDPRPVAWENYQKYSQLANWNNEGTSKNETYNVNYAKTQKFVWVLATEDGMVWPKEGEQWGAADPQAPFTRVLTLNETEWYKKDLFGLRTAQEQGKNRFESFAGDHLQFTMDDFTRWVQTYIGESSHQDNQVQ